MICSGFSDYLRYYFCTCGRVDQVISRIPVRSHCTVLRSTFNPSRTPMVKSSKLRFLSLDMTSIFWRKATSVLSSTTGRVAQWHYHPWCFEKVYERPRTHCRSVRTVPRCCFNRLCHHVLLHSDHNTFIRRRHRTVMTASIQNMVLLFLSQCQCWLLHMTTTTILSRTTAQAPWWTRLCFHVLLLMTSSILTSSWQLLTSRILPEGDCHCYQRQPQQILRLLPLRLETNLSHPRGVQEGVVEDTVAPNVELMSRFVTEISKKIPFIAQVVLAGFWLRPAPLRLMALRQRKILTRNTLTQKGTNRKILISWCNM